MTKKDFLEEVVGERSMENPGFPDLVDAALERRQRLLTIAERLKEPGGEGHGTRGEPHFNYTDLLGSEATHDDEANPT